MLNWLKKTLNRDKIADQNTTATAAGEATESAAEDEQAGSGLFHRLRERLGKTRHHLVQGLDRLLLGKKQIDSELFDELEELLITADLGVNTSLALIEEARKEVKREQLNDPAALKAILKAKMLQAIQFEDSSAQELPQPLVIMVVGINGVGKTTTIGKLAAQFTRAGHKVLLVAADTFRAAAIDQLKIWGERSGAEVLAREPGADPASVAYDGLDYGLAQGKDVILIDTAGRLHTSVNLMEELKKVQRVLAKRLPGAPHEVLQVLDATTGQNGLAQARIFHEAVGLTGLVLTKLDGTAKGGLVIGVCQELKVPVRFIGLGEQVDDLRNFEPVEFLDALFAG